MHTMAEKIVIILSAVVGLRCDIKLIQFVMINGTFKVKSLRRLLCHGQYQYHDNRCLKLVDFHAPQ